MRQALQLDLRAEDLALVAAAIELGDWLLAYPACTPTQARAIRYLQEHLRQLPLVSPEMLEAEYGFAILIGAGWDTVTTEPREGLARGWSISLSVAELLVSTIHTANPEIPAHLNEHESFFEFFVGETKSRFQAGILVRLARRRSAAAGARYGWRRVSGRNRNLGRRRASGHTEVRVAISGSLQFSSILGEISPVKRRSSDLRPLGRSLAPARLFVSNRQVLRS
jgi:hypothetical protein